MATIDKISIDNLIDYTKLKQIASCDFGVFNSIAPTGCGIYLIRFANGSLYVGQTQNLYGRCYRHFNNLSKNIKDVNSNINNAYKASKESFIIYKIKDSYPSKYPNEDDFITVVDSPLNKIGRRVVEYNRFFLVCRYLGIDVEKYLLYTNHNPTIRLNYDVSGAPLQSLRATILGDLVDRGNVKPEIRESAMGRNLTISKYLEFIREEQQKLFHSSLCKISIELRRLAGIIGNANHLRLNEAENKLKDVLKGSVLLCIELENAKQRIFETIKQKDL